ncbi:MAG: hypothetical protein EP298_03395 [Gammaproteobacteria bacterium]|nr:MAG: hypothetical protein EP298_03395 [Gammaproteobacteria bacterium]UTW43503.1 PAS domain-containing sensor histidine kinase [bacterium SCSIO 12844]
MNFKNYHLYDFIDNMPSYVYIKDVNSRYIYCNKHLANTLNLKHSNEISGKTDNDFKWGDKLANQFIADDHYVISTTKKLVTDYLLPTGLNSTGYIRTEKNPLYNNKGEIIGIIGLAYEVTDFDINSICNNSNEALNNDQFNIIQNIQHDIRTPLTGISGLVDYILSSNKEISFKTFLEDIKFCSNELLNYSSSTLEHLSSDGDLKKSSNIIDLNKLAHDVQLVFKPIITQRKISFITEIDKHIQVNVLSSEFKLKSILINLISNSIKYSDIEGQIRLSIKHVYQSQSKILIDFAVEDNGIGIHPADQSLIFDKFYHKNDLNNQSHGLGLSIVNQFVNQLGGTIKLIEDVKQGTKFSLRFPFQYILKEKEK